jgi:hypothetical protein
MGQGEQVLGFDGLTAPRILLMRYGVSYVKSALSEAMHFKEGSINGAVLKAMYGIVKAESLYKRIFGEHAGFLSGMAEDELRAIVGGNKNLDSDQRKTAYAYFDSLDVIVKKLDSHV